MTHASKNLHLNLDEVDGSCVTKPVDKQDEEDAPDGDSTVSTPSSPEIVVKQGTEIFQSSDTYALSPGRTRGKALIGKRRLLHS